MDILYNEVILGSKIFGEPNLWKKTVLLELNIARSYIIAAAKDLAPYNCKYFNNKSLGDSGKHEGLPFWIRRRCLRLIAHGRTKQRTKARTMPKSNRNVPEPSSAKRCCEASAPGLSCTSPTISRTAASSRDTTTMCSTDTFNTTEITVRRSSSDCGVSIACDDCLIWRLEIKSVHSLRLKTTLLFRIAASKKNLLKNHFSDKK